MKRKKGFTLIELLVVVLIIGILAAIALPQYQKAVERARVAKIQTFLKDIVNAQNLYQLEHGTYAAKFDQLAITPSQKSNFTQCAAYCGDRTDCNGTAPSDAVCIDDWSVSLQGSNSVLAWKTQPNKYEIGWAMRYANPQQFFCIHRSDEVNTNGYCPKLFNLSKRTDCLGGGYVMCYI
jgi:type II secretion system protein G